MVLEESVLGGLPAIFTWAQIAGGLTSAAVVAFGLSTRTIFRNPWFRIPVCGIGAGGVLYAVGFFACVPAAVKVGVSLYGFCTTALLISKLIHER